MAHSTNNFFNAPECSGGTLYSPDQNWVPSIHSSLFFQIVMIQLRAVWGTLTPASKQMIKWLEQHVNHGCICVAVPPHTHKTFVYNRNRRHSYAFPFTAFHCSAKWLHIKLTSFLWPRSRKGFFSFLEFRVRVRVRARWHPAGSTI